MREEEILEAIFSSSILKEKLEKHRLNCETCLNPKTGIRVHFKDGTEGVVNEYAEVLEGKLEEVLEPYKDQIKSYERFKYPCVVEELIRNQYNTNVVMPALIESMPRDIVAKGEIIDKGK